MDCSVLFGCFKHVCFIWRQIFDSCSMRQRYMVDSSASQGSERQIWLHRIVCMFMVVSSHNIWSLFGLVILIELASISRPESLMQEGVLELEPELK